MNNNESTKWTAVHVITPNTTQHCCSWCELDIEPAAWCVTGMYSSDEIDGGPVLSDDYACTDHAALHFAEVPLPQTYRTLAVFSGGRHGLAERFWTVHPTFEAMVRTLHSPARTEVWVETARSTAEHVATTGHQRCTFVSRSDSKIHLTMHAFAPSKAVAPAGI